MAENRLVTTQQNLPTAAPDLVVAGHGRAWRVVQISPSLAAIVRKSPKELSGASLEQVLPDVHPSLSDLAREVAEGAEPLTNIHVSIPHGLPSTMSVEVQPGGLSADYRDRLVTFFVRPLTRAEGEVETARFGIVGISPAILEVFRKIDLYASSDATVVITGETGTGKELVARALHQASPRSSGPFLAVNCSAISEELLESELFGHEKGAFTGAVRTHRGRFERADGGTLFLDEIGDMPLHTQAKLLRVLEERKIERVGSESAREVDVRVLGATNVPLERAVGNGTFRPDLYHRFSVLRIHLPPLRKRPEDIPVLAEHFLDQFSRKYECPARRLTPEALRLLQSYLWPGNVRELRNVLERVVIETRSEAIGARAFGEWIRERQNFEPGRWETAGLGQSSADALTPPYPLPSERRLLTHDKPLLIEKNGARAPEARRRTTRPAELDAEEITRAFHSSGGNLTQAARLLGVHRATLYRYLKKLGLSRGDLEKGEQ